MKILFIGFEKMEWTTLGGYLYLKKKLHLVNVAALRAANLVNVDVAALRAADLVNVHVAALRAADLVNADVGSASRCDVRRRIQKSYFVGGGLPLTCPQARQGGTETDLRSRT